jgi:hypothetical protein
VPITKFRACSPLYQGAAIRSDIARNRTFVVYDRYHRPVMNGKFTCSLENLPENDTVPVMLEGEAQQKWIKLSDMGIIKDTRNRWHENRFTVVGRIHRAYRL